MSIALGHSGRMSGIAVAFGVAVLAQLPMAASAGAATATTSNGVACTIVGTSKADTLKGTSGRDVVCGLGGNDKITGRGGDDVIDAGTGNDTVYGGPGNDLIYGGTGTDKLYGDTGDDTCDAATGEGATSCSADTAKPVANSWTLDKTSVNTATGAQTVVVTARVTDNFAGVPSVGLRLAGPNGAVYGGAATRTGGGTDLDATYRLPIVFPADAPVGSYTLAIEATDRAGNVRAPATSTTVKQTYAGDVTAPFVGKWTVQGSLEEDADAATVVATAIVTDVSGVATVAVRFVRGDLEFGGVAVKTTGDTYRAEFQLPAEDFEGSYDVYVDATDTKGNAAAKKLGTLEIN